MPNPRVKLYRDEAERSKWRIFERNLNIQDTDTCMELVRDLFLLTLRSAKNNTEVEDALAVLHKRYKRRVELVGSVG